MTSTKSGSFCGFQEVEIYNNEWNPWTGSAEADLLEEVVTASKEYFDLGEDDDLLELQRRYQNDPEKMVTFLPSTQWY